jgi:hypothetical protein
MAEIELNVLVRQYLNHWIAKIEVMRNEVNALESGRNRMNAPVNWQFTTEDPTGTAKCFRNGYAGVV